MPKPSRSQVYLFLYLVLTFILYSISWSLEIYVYVYVYVDTINGRHNLAKKKLHRQSDVRRLQIHGNIQLSLICTKCAFLSLNHKIKLYWPT